MKKDQTIENKQSGETLTMLAGEDENRGAVQIYCVHLPPRRPSPPLHYHLAFTETLTVQEGPLAENGVRIGDLPRGAHRGSTALGIMVPHTAPLPSLPATHWLHYTP
jgi:hypothetical protein